MMLQEMVNGTINYIKRKILFWKNNIRCEFQFFFIFHFFYLGNVKIAELLLFNDADINIENVDGKMSRDLAVENGSIFKRSPN